MQIQTERRLETENKRARGNNDDHAHVHCLSQGTMRTNKIQGELKTNKIMTVRRILASKGEAYMALRDVTADQQCQSQWTCNSEARSTNRRELGMNPDETARVRRLSLEDLRNGSSALLPAQTARHRGSSAATAHFLNTVHPTLTVYGSSRSRSYRPPPALWSLCF